MYKKIAVAFMCLGLTCAHAGMVKKALIVGGAVYAGKALANKHQEKKQQSLQQNQSWNGPIARNPDYRLQPNTSGNPYIYPAPTGAHKWTNPVIPSNPGYQR